MSSNTCSQEVPRIRKLCGINDGGQIVGPYQTTDTSNLLGFEDSNGSFTTINFPAVVDGLIVDGINNAGQLVGGYTDGSGTTHGFVSATGPFAYAPIRSTNSVAVFDIPTTFQLPSIPVGTGPVGIGLGPNGTLAYVANYDWNTVATDGERLLLWLPMVPDPERQDLQRLGCLRQSPKSPRWAPHVRASGLSRI